MYRGFNTVNNDFPSRENYNNLGVAKARKHDLKNQMQLKNKPRFYNPIKKLKIKAD
jgi:hypothetical protein